ncbi:MAG: DMT family transporter [Bacteroidales bacterium]|nr:DMT family transporter [Bacteroidales bacterium]
MAQKKHNWLLYAIITMVTWGVWMTFSDPTIGNIYLGIPSDFPSEMVYVVWALSMIPCALFALINIKFKLDVRPKSAALSMGVGLLGAGGQLVLFLALKYAPSYLVMPMISVAPIVTVLLSATFLKEKVSRLGILGIVLAFVAIICFAIPTDKDGTVSSWVWILLAAVVFVCWGIQAFVMKLANNHTPDAESVFVYMAIAAVLLIPVAFLLKSPSELVAYGWAAPGKVFLVQILNAVGALTLVYANRYGKAMVIAPLADACSPVICCLLSIVLLLIAGLNAIPTVWQVCGMVAAISCVFIFSRE